MSETQTVHVPQQEGEIRLSGGRLPEDLVFTVQAGKVEVPAEQVALFLHYVPGSALVEPAAGRSSDDSAGSPGGESTSRPTRQKEA